MRSELVKDCTGFANANGGTLIYGIEEGTEDGVSVAIDFALVLDSKIGKDWISEVLRSNTSPPLNAFDISELVVSGRDGRAIVIEIQPASTAHQNLKDLRYYQRSGAVTSPMVDFQIRDVMNRRSRPDVAVDVQMTPFTMTGDLHRYQLRVVLENIGAVTLEKWAFQIDIPANVVGDSRPGSFPMIHRGYSQLLRAPLGDPQNPIAQVTFGDPAWNGQSQTLHPGQSIDFDARFGDFPSFIIEVDNTRFERHSGAQTPLQWRLFAPNVKPFVGTVPFDAWCRF